MDCLKVLDDRNVDLLANGGYVYVDEEDHVCGINAIHEGDADRKALRLDGPYPLDTLAAGNLRSSERFMKVTLHSLVEMGAQVSNKYY